MSYRRTHKSTSHASVALCSALAAAVASISVVGLTVGDFPVPVSSVFSALSERDSDLGYVVTSLRMPRIVVAALGGACLAASGALLQELVDNPLASPDVVGLDTAAAAGVVIAIAAGLNLGALPVVAFISALTAAALIVMLAWKRGLVAGRLVLVGVGLKILFAAVVAFVLVLGSIGGLSTGARWQIGTLEGSDWNDAATLATAAALLVPASLLMLQRLRVLQLGDDIATALGSSVTRDRIAIVAVACALASVATSVIGPLAFVALTAPQLARKLTGPLRGSVVALALLLGALIVQVSDLIAQRLLAPRVLPTGLVTAAIGAPYLVLLLRRTNRVT